MQCFLSVWVNIAKIEKSKQKEVFFLPPLLLFVFCLPPPPYSPPPPHSCQPDCLRVEVYLSIFGLSGCCCLDMNHESFFLFPSGDAGCQLLWLQRCSVAKRERHLERKWELFLLSTFLLYCCCFCLCPRFYYYYYHYFVTVYRPPCVCLSRHVRQSCLNVCLTLAVVHENVGTLPVMSIVFGGWLYKPNLKTIIFAQACERFSFFQLQNNVLNDYRNVVNYKVS